MKKRNLLYEEAEMETMLTCFSKSFFLRIIWSKNET